MEKFEKEVKIIFTVCLYVCWVWFSQHIGTNIYRESETHMEEF